MEQYTRGFIRAMRKLDTADDLARLILSIEPENTTQVTPADRLRILDFPDEETQESNIAATTPSLSRRALLERAVESPRELTTAELDLLKERFWLDVRSAERWQRIGADEALTKVSEQHWYEVTDRLKALRAPLYGELEQQAIDGAAAESYRRIREPLDASKLANAKAGVARSAPWVRRLWEDHLGGLQGRARWGYAVFEEPVFEDEEQRSDFDSRRGAAVFHAHGAIGCGTTITARWLWRTLDWPVEGKLDLEKRRDVEFQKLRERFLAVRDGEGRGLNEGILRNVVLVVDQESVNSVLSEFRFIDDMWVWALDPDYNGTDTETRPADDQDAEYRGYLRVRLQQLVNNFFAVRCFQEEEYSMRDLWEAARQSRNQAFVSVKAEEAGLWQGSRITGSALKYVQTDTTAQD